MNHEPICQCFYCLFVPSVFVSLKTKGRCQFYLCLLGINQWNSVDMSCCHSTLWCKRSHLSSLWKDQKDNWRPMAIGPNSWSVCWMLIPNLKVNRGHDLKPSMDTVWDLLQQNWLLVCCRHRWSVCILKCPPHISSSRRCAYWQWESALYRRNPINFVCSAWIIQVIVRKSSKRKENKPYSFFSCLPNQDKAKVFQSKPRWHYFKFL